MASAFEVADFRNTVLSAFGETIIRRIGGSDVRTESISANVDFDERQMAKVAQDTGGQFASDRGQYLEERGLLDLAADQETTPQDSFVIDGKVYRTVGEIVGRDPGCKTIVISRRTAQIAREARLNRR